MTINISDTRTDTVELIGDTQLIQDSISDSVNELINPRNISLKHNQNGRNILSKELKKMRRWRDTSRSDLNKANEEIVETQTILYDLDSERRRYKSSKLGSIFNFLEKKGFTKNRRQLKINHEIGLLTLQEAAYAEEIKMQDKRVRIYLNLPKKLLGEFKDATYNIPLSIEEKKELLKPDVLSSLSMEEYISLWRRLNPYFLGHVTRQGFRDHNAMSMHSGGLEEYHEGFTSVLDDSKLLRPPISIHSGLNPYDEQSICNFVEKEVLGEASSSQAKDKLQSILWDTLAAAPKYAAGTSIHFAKEEIANDTYGGESGNEIFYIFPSDVIASQFNYSFNWTSNFREKQHEQKWNDVFVWPNDRNTNAIMLDMGVVFLPEDALVDQDTGSKYEYKMEEGIKKMIEDEKSKEIVRGILTSLVGQDSDNDMMLSFLLLMSQHGYSLSKPTFHTHSVLEAYIHNFDNTDVQNNEEKIRILLKEIGLLWKLSTNTISSHDYWEGFFNKNPEKKPRHIVYYRGSPTEAVQDFLIENKIKTPISVSDTGGDPLLGLGDKCIENMKEDVRARPHYDFLIEVAHGVIDRHFGARPH